MDIQYVTISGKSYPVYFGARQVATLESAQVPLAQGNPDKSFDLILQAFAGASAKGANRTDQPGLSLTADQIEKAMDDDASVEDQFYEAYQQFLPKPKDGDKKKAKSRTGTK